MSTPKTITILFTCHRCKKVKVQCEVRERKDEEDVLEWMRMVTQKVFERHATLSIFCNESKADIMVPTTVNGTQCRGIGFLPE